MNRLYSTLAITNIKKNKLFYIPYIVSGILVVSFVYMMSFMGDNKGIEGMFAGDQIRLLMHLGLVIILIFSYIFLFYTNSFLIKRRKKEFGVYNMLGMEKRHISRVFAMESLIVAFVSIGCGLLVGIAFSKLSMMLFFHIIRIETSFVFSICGESILFTVVAFGILYFLILIYNCLQIRMSNTMELIRGGNVGEREPKTKVILSLIGFACLFAGYYMSITIKNPVTAILLFFVAVILVIVGTYLLFTTGSIFVLKLLKKNKKFYYNKRHMTAVAGMLYRMKQNAVGLANICILSTMVLVTISTTVSLYAGLEGTVDSMYSAEMNINAYSYGSIGEKRDEVLPFVEEVAKEHNLEVKGSVAMSSFSAFGNVQDGVFLANKETIGDTEQGDLLVFLTKEDFLVNCADYDKEVPKLEDDEVFIISTGERYQEDNLEIFGTNYQVKGSDIYTDRNVSGMDVTVDRVLYVAVKDLAAFNQAYELQVANRPEDTVTYCVNYYVECEGENKDKVAFANDLDERIAQMDSAAMFGPYHSLRTISKEEARIEYYYTFGGLFFLGIICGLMFLMVTVMIIFYKQISEGYDDRERYSIMEKVGMSQKEVKNTITSQVRMVFFLPLVVGYCHLAGSFPMIRLMMSVIFMSNVTNFIICLLITSIIFAVIYYFIFKITSKTYYAIVK